MSWRYCCLVAAMFLGTGCARIVANPKEPSKLPRARLAPDAVALDVAFVRLPAADLERYEAIWTTADEQHFPAELRRDLTTNGLRVAVVGQDLPAPLREQLDAKRNVLEENSEDIDTSDLEIGGGKRHLQIRAGRRTKILASKTYPSLAVLVSQEGQVRGDQLRQAQCLWALKSYPQGDGRVKLELTPEIEHGEMKTQWAGSEGSFMQRLGRDRLVLDRLRLDAKLAPGEWLVVSTTRDLKGLGEYYFAETVGGTLDRTFLLIRLAQTQQDDLFTPAQTSAALVTPAE